MPQTQSWRIEASTTVYESAPWLRIQKQSVVTPNGHPIDDWHVIELPSFVNVMARLEGGGFLLLRQNKFLCQGESLATVGGLIDPGETPRSAAERELWEESGCRSQTWVELGDYVIDPNRGCGRCYLFFADHCKRCEPASAPDAEQLDILVVSEQELLQIALSPEVKSLAWATCILKTLLWKNLQTYSARSPQDSG